MPTRPSHLPDTRERSALQKMHADRGLPLAALHPSSKQAIGKMIIKGWVAVDDKSPSMTFRITPAGVAALRAKIPEPASKRGWTADEGKRLKQG
jgi:hypothetical protein